MRVATLALLTTTLAALAIAAPAGAATGALTFNSCGKGTPVAPCTAPGSLSGPVDLVSGATQITVANADGHALSVLNRNPLTAISCLGDGTLPSCGAHTPASGSPLPAGVYANAAGVASATVGGATFLTSSANNSIAEFLSSSDHCVAEGGAMGCDSAHGLHVPTDLALATTSPLLAPSQLYAATGDGVAWFNVSGVDERLTYAGCLAAGAIDTCGATTMSGGTAIAVSPDAQSVYAGSFNSQVVGYRRDATGALTQISCAIESASPPAGCVTGNGIHRVSGLAVSPDGHNLYVVSTLAPQAIATFARATDGTITETGCIAATASDGCTADADLTTVDSVAVSPDGRNVYVGSTLADVAVFNRAADGTLTAAGCLTGHGPGTCANFGFGNYAGAISVSGDGKWVDAVAQDFNGVATFARTRESADLDVSSAGWATLGPGATASRTFTVVNHGPDPADAAQLEIDAPDRVDLSATTTVGTCSNVSPDVHTNVEKCDLGTLASGASAQVTVHITDNQDPGSTATIAAIASPAVYIDDPVAANNRVNPAIVACAGPTLLASGPCPNPAPPITTTTTTTPVPSTRPAKLVISRARLSPSTFAVKGTRVSAASRRHHRHVHVGTTLHYSLSRAATITVTVASVHGKRVRTLGAVLRRPAKATSAFNLSGRLHGKALAPGHYRATITATARGFTAATPRTLRLTIVRR